MSRIIKKGSIVHCFCLALFFGKGVNIHAVSKEAEFSMRLTDWKFEAGLGVGVTTSTEFTRQFERASYVFPSGYAMGWYNQPWLLKNRLYAGFGIGYLRVFSADSDQGLSSGGFAIPLTLEAMYLLPRRFFVTAGFGMAPGAITLNGVSESTNAFAAVLSGGYEYPISSGISFTGKIRLMLLSQRLVFENGNEVGNASVNFGLLLGATYRFVR